MHQGIFFPKIAERGCLSLLKDWLLPSHDRFDNINPETTLFDLLELVNLQLSHLFDLMNFLKIAINFYNRDVSVNCVPYSVSSQSSFNIHYRNDFSRLWLLNHFGKAN